MHLVGGKDAAAPPRLLVFLSKAINFCCQTGVPTRASAAVFY